MAIHLAAVLEEHRQRRDLVSLRRDKIDDQAIQGYVLAVSDELVALQFVYDFRLDGLRILRVRDVTGVACTSVDRFQRELLVREGLEKAIPFGRTFALRDWRPLISQLAREFPLMILECEALDEPDFVIGRARSITETSVEFDHFSGVASWEAKPAMLALADLTSCQVETNYINVYRRHFERLARS